jgi:hypothetical protein
MSSTEDNESYMQNPPGARALADLRSARGLARPAHPRRHLVRSYRTPRAGSSKPTAAGANVEITLPALVTPLSYRKDH